MLLKAHRQEALSRAYVHAVAARCGLGCSPREFDYGIDLTVHDIRVRGRRYVESGFNLDIQAKSSTAAVVTASHVLYDLGVKSYDDLRETDVGCPRILVLLVLPEDEGSWVEQTEDGMVVRRCAYWVSLAGGGATDNSATIRIAVPRDNVFSAGALGRMMDKVRRGEAL